MSFVRFVIKKDLRQLFGRPLILLLWAGIPFAIGTLITLMSSGGNLPKAQVLVVDEDESLVSQVIVGAMGTGPVQEMIELETVSRAAGDARIEAGDGTALLIIPDGFGDAFLAETPTELTLRTNPAQVVLPELVEQGTRVLVDGGFYLHRILGDELRVVAEGDTTTATVTQAAATTLRASQRLKPYLFPPAIQVEAAVEDADAFPVTFAFLMMPGMLIMALLFTAQGLGITYWDEREGGTLRRLAGTPTSVTLLLLGKLVAGACITAVICAVLLAIGMGYHGLPWVRFPLALVWMVTAGMVFYLALALVQFLTPHRRAGTFATNLITLPLLMAGGSFFPMETMPGWLAQVGQWTPNGYALTQLQAILLGTSNAATLGLAFGVLVGVGAVFFVLNARQNHRIATLS